jgi:hypothetical protein
MSLTRKEFLTTVVGAAAGVAGAAALAACGGSNGDSTDAGVAKNCATNGGLAAIGANHGHMMTVAAADVNAGVEKTYTLQGASNGHTHMVTVTAAQFNTMKTNPGTNITINSTPSDMAPTHMHAVMISCA